MVYFETIKRNLALRDQPRLLARRQHLVKIKGQTEVSKGRRIVRVQANRSPVVQHRLDQVRRYRGGITLEKGAIEIVSAMSRGLGNGQEGPYQYLVPTNARCSISSVACEWTNEVTNEILERSCASYIYL